MHGILQRADLRALLDDVRLGDTEGLAVTVVEAPRDVARDLQVLALIDTDGHDVRLIEEDVRRHQDGICHESHVDVLGMLCSLVLELRHALHFADIGDGVEDPGEFRVRGDVRLNIERALLGIDAAGNVERRKL